VTAWGLGIRLVRPIGYGFLPSYPPASGTRIGAFLGAWERVYEDRSVTVSDVLRNIGVEKKKDDDAADTHVLLLADAIQTFVPAKAGEFPSVFAIGKKLGNIKDSVHSGRRIIAGGERDGTTLWKVEHVAAPTPERCTEPEPEVDPDPKYLLENV